MISKAKAALLLLTALIAARAAYGQYRDQGLLPEQGGEFQTVWVFLKHEPPSLGRDHATIVPSARTLDRRVRRGSLTIEQYQCLDRQPDPWKVESIRQTGAEIRHVSRWLKAVSIRATSEQIATISAFSWVTGIEPVRGWRPTSPQDERRTGLPVAKPARTDSLDYGPSFHQLEMINVPAVHREGYSGKGILVLVLDTGFYKEHESIDTSRIVAEYDFINADTNTQNETAEEDSLQQHSHGTRVISVLGGYRPGQLVGPAYACEFLLAKTEVVHYDSLFEEDHFVAALEWGEALGADIVSSSIGYLYWYTYESLDGQTAITTLAVRQAVRMGMLVVVGAGNERQNTNWGGYIIVPADADSIIAVGAVTTDGTIASFSSHGPTYDGRIKPELVAQGMQVACAATRDTSTYTYTNGTSFSAPLVAGSAALLMEAHPDWGPMNVRDALLATASNADSANNDYGWGIPDVLAALNHNPTASFPDIHVSRGEDLPYFTQIFPNPLSSGHQSTFITIRWVSPYTASISLDLYDLLGQHILNLYAPQKNLPGSGMTTWSGHDLQGKALPTGVYMLRLSAGSKSVTKRVTLLR
jgi:hypothetical protein